MSRNLARYLQLRANGATMMTASMQAEIAVAEARLIENDIARGLLQLPPPAAEEPVQPQKENTMGRPKKADAPQVEELKAPDFDRAVKIYRTDIKPANEKSGEEAQKASTGYKAIKKDCHVNTRAAKFVFQLAGESEEKRDDVLRSLRGLLKAMNIGITNDLVARAEGEGADEPIVPAAPAEKLKLVTLDD